MTHDKTKNNKNVEQNSWKMELEVGISRFLSTWLKINHSTKLKCTYSKIYSCYKINRKFRVATEIGSTFFGYKSVNKKRNYSLGLIQYQFSDRKSTIMTYLYFETLAGSWPLNPWSIEVPSWGP
jgi:hypothetical protein